MRLIIDMNLSPKWAAFLCQAGFDAKHWSELGDAHAADAEILSHAKTNAAIVLTHDLDFGAILAASGGNSPSVIQLRADDLSTEAIGSAVCMVLRQERIAIEQGALVTLDTARGRISLLPIGNAD